MKVVICIVFLLIIEIVFSPKGDWTDEDEFLLWYTPLFKKKREYIKLYPLI